MRKFLVVLLALALIFAFAACGEQAAPAEEAEAEEGLTAIPLGGGLPDFNAVGAPYGAYTQIEAPVDFEDPDCDECSVYYAPEANTAYIAVYRWAKDGMTLEEQTAAISEAYGGSGYQIVKWPDMGLEQVGYFTVGAEIFDGNYYYVECDIMEDGDDFVEIDFYNSTEELALGESGQYLWVPKGYTDGLDEDEIAHGGIFDGLYDKEYSLPNIWIDREDYRYDTLAWFWEEIYPEGLPFDEASYDAMMTQWEDAIAAGEDTMGFVDQYYEMLGVADVRTLHTEINGCSMDVGSGTVADFFICEIDLSCGEEEGYCIFLSSGTSLQLRYGKALADSLHSK